MTDGNPAALTAAVLDEESRRQAVQDERSAVTVLPDDLLPGVGGEQLGLKATLKAGGVSTIAVIFVMIVVEQFSRVGIGVLGPDIQTTLNISDTTLVAISAFSGVALVLGAVPIAWLADRMPRKYVVVGSTVFGGVALLLTGVVVNPFQMFWALAAVSFSYAYAIPVFGSLMADQYPINGRSRIFAIFFMAQPLGALIAPFLVGLIADRAGGTEGWRWVYLLVAIPTFLMAVVAAFVLREPVRGKYEQQLILGHELEHTDVRKELPVSISNAYQRMKKIKTFYFICIGIGVLGFAFVAVPVQLGLLLRDSYGYGPYARGWITSVGFIASLIAIPIAGFMFDRAFRKNPERVVRIAGGLIFGYGALMLIGLRMKEIVLLMLFVSLANACTGAAFVGIGPIIGGVAPYRLRSQAFALVPVFIFLVGGFFGGLMTGALSDAHGERTALTIVIPFAAGIGGALFVHGARYLKRDISLAVEELLEEQAELQRISASPETIPMLQVRNLDYSYGPVQVLFDVGFEVQKGEVLALLGTNGAGKSTLLRAISGLGIPDRGVVRLDGQTLTYVDAELRFQAGIVQLRGGAGVFPELTVRDNLKASLLSTKMRPAELRARIERISELFPILRERMDQPARDLSGGQQQMLALALALMHDPKVLLIDELSLGLAPLVVQELIGVVERLRAQGLTMVIVEQSLNVALSVADRAIFMEKGRVRFEGSARELAERDDLARAVFLGGEGG